MSENEETATALDRIRGWREEYRLGLAPSPLEDVTQLSAQLDLTHAHPSGHRAAVRQRTRHLGLVVPRQRHAARRGQACGTRARRP